MNQTRDMFIGVRVSKDTLVKLDAKVERYSPLNRSQLIRELVEGFADGRITLKVGGVK